MRRATRISDSANRRHIRSANPREGSTLESYLREQGLYEEASTRGIKEVLAWQVVQAMKDQKIAKAEMARRMGTSRSALARLLDPTNEAVTLSTLFRAANVLGAELRVELIRPIATARRQARLRPRSRQGR